MKRILQTSELKNNEFHKWNMFIDLIAVEAYEDLSEIQKIAHLSFWIDSEVQNGGIVQYFTNMTSSKFDESLDSLLSIGAIEHRRILNRVYDIYDEIGVSNVSKEKFIDCVLVGYEYEFESDEKEEAFGKIIDEIDYSYYDVTPTVTDFLQIYFKQNEDEFIEIVENEVNVVK